MGINYLKERSWSEWTRDERYYCSVLYSQAVDDVEGFASWVIDKAHLELSKKGAWELGYEVCFYRDYLWQLGRSARSEGFSPKRTFDFCLFGEEQIIVIEAKVFQPFSRRQNDEFEKDMQKIRELPELKHVETAVVALASSRYFKNATKFGCPATLAGFGGKISWAQAAEKYDHPSLRRADQLYKMRPGAFSGEMHA